MGVGLAIMSHLLMMAQLDSARVELEVLSTQTMVGLRILKIAQKASLDPSSLSYALFVLSHAVGMPLVGIRAATSL
jgi:hypothetical protein